MYKIHFSRFIGLLSILALALSACLPVTPRIGGIVQGVVYGDLNGDGAIDASEETSRVEGAQVLLEDCGPNQFIITDAEGKFKFQDLPEGTCHVSISKAGWIYAGMFPALGVYPIPVASDPDLATAFSIFMAPVMDFIPSDTPTPIPDESSTLVGPTNTPTLVVSPTPVAPMVKTKAEDTNCRFGPGTAFLSIGALRAGNIVPILGSTADQTWWQIENPLAIGTLCWVSAAVTETSGDLALVPVVDIPIAFVTEVTVSTPAVVHGYCGGPNATSFAGTITTNGPVTVAFHWEIYDAAGTKLNATSDENLVFATFGTQNAPDPGAYKRDCGDYVVKLVVTTPNSKSAQASWSVVSP